MSLEKLIYKYIFFKDSVFPDEVMYLSWTSKKALPDTPPANVKYVVLCASNDLDPSTSSLSAAKQLDLPCYRIPTEKHVM